MKPLIIVLNAIEKFTEITGRLIAWLTMAMVALVVLVVVTRYFLEVGSIALQESVTYLHCLVFLMGLAFTLKHDGHVLNMACQQVHNNSGRVSPETSGIVRW